MIHIVIAGRPHIIDDIEETLGESIPRININKSKNKKDIVDYIRDRIITSKVLKTVEKKLQEEILETVAEKANGMFMWAFFMMQELRQKNRASHIRDSLHRASQNPPLQKKQNKSNQINQLTIIHIKPDSNSTLSAKTSKAIV